MNELKKQIEFDGLLTIQRHKETVEIDLDRLMQLIETYTAKQCFKEVVGFAGTNHSNRKFCDHYEERYKYFKGKSDQLSSQLTNNKEGIEK